MTQQALSFGGGILLPRQMNFTNADSVQTLDATTDYVTFAFKVPKTGTIDSVTIRVFASSLSGTLSAQIQTLDSAGDPSGTAYGSCAQVDITNPAAATNHTFSSLGCSATVGDWVGVKVWISALTSGSCSIIVTAHPTAVGGAYTTYRVTGTGAGTHQQGMVCSVVYSGGQSYDIPGSVPCCTTQGDNLDADGTVRRAGNRFTLPVPVTVAGLWAFLDHDTDTTTLKLYDTDGTTVLGTCTLSTGARGSPGSHLVAVSFDSGSTVALAANAGPYRCVVETNNTSTIAVGVRGIANVSSLASLEQLDLGQMMYGTTHNGSAWTDYGTAGAVRRYSVGLMVSGFADDAGSGGGLLIHPGMHGGMRG